MAKNKTHKLKRKLLYLLLAVVALAIVVFILEVTNTTHIFHKTGIVSAPSKPISSLPAQPATTKSQSTSSGVSQGNATDENGKTATGVSSNPNQWAISSSGQLTLKSPLKGATFQSGDTITGTSSMNPVQYRLIDNQVGVIAQGPLNVVNGNFTATISFTPTSSSGQLDVYNTDSNGKEINEIQIPVNFQQ